MSRSSVVAALAVAGALATTGCVETALLEARQPMDYGGHEPAPAPAPTPGAIWTGTLPSGSFLSFDRKARGVGDLVTVLVVEETEAESAARTEAASDSNLSAGVASDVRIDRLVAGTIEKLLGTARFGGSRRVPPGERINVVEGETQNEFEGDASTERSGRFEATITCRVIAELPGDVLHVRGRRATVVNHELQYLTLEGLVRRQDIGIDNVVASTALAEARITLDGIGVVDDKQRPGWLGRVFSWLYPL